MELLRAVNAVLFPPHCRSCEAITDNLTSELFCAQCAGKIQYVCSPLCPVCGAPVPGREGEDTLCGDCRTSLPPFSVARSVAVFAEGLLQVVHNFKYHHHTSLARGLSKMMISHACTGLDMEDYDLIMPVPLHVRRLRERGFNQSLLLAKEISRRHSIPLDFLTLRRHRDTPPQTLLDRKERQANIRGAFGVADANRIRKKRILLIDDVYTTGSTLSECARVLIGSGSGRVGVLTLARAATGDRQ